MKVLNLRDYELYQLLKSIKEQEKQKSKYVNQIDLGKIRKTRKLIIIIFDCRRTRSLNAPSPFQQFGPCGRIMKNSAMVM